MAIAKLQKLSKLPKTSSISPQRVNIAINVFSRPLLSEMHPQTIRPKLFKIETVITANVSCARICENSAVGMILAILTKPAAAGACQILTKFMITINPTASPIE